MPKNTKHTPYSLLHDAVYAYVLMFEKKHGYESDGFVSDDITGVCGFISQYYFSLSDIVFDIENNLPKGLIFEWQNHNLEQHYKDPKSPIINLRNYAMGARYGIIAKPTESDLKQAEIRQARIAEIDVFLETEIKRAKIGRAHV